MTIQNRNATADSLDALSDNDLNAVSGGAAKKRVEVTKAEYEQCLAVRMMFANLK